MPQLTLPVAPTGPLLDMVIGVSHPRAEALRTRGLPVPPAVHVRGLVDTGASGTCVDPGVLQSLGLSPTGTTSVYTPSTGTTPHTTNLYDVGLLLTHPTADYNLQNMPVMEAHLVVQGIQALIGRDVLAHCLFIYNGPTDTFTLAF